MAADFWTFAHIPFLSDGGAAFERQHKAAERVKARGATWARFTRVIGGVVVEGWVERPDDEGPLPTVDTMDLAREI